MTLDDLVFIFIILLVLLFFVHTTVKYFWT